MIKKLKKLWEWFNMKMEIETYDTLKGVLENAECIFE